MPYIKVDVDKIRAFQQEVSNIGRSITSISSSFLSIYRSLDSDIKNSSGINRKLKNIETSLESYKSVLNKTNTFLGNASSKYSNADKTISPQIKLINASWGARPATAPEASDQSPTTQESSKGLFVNTEAKNDSFKIKSGTELFEESLNDIEKKGNDYFEKKGWRDEDKKETYKKKETTEDGKTQWTEIDSDSAPTFYDKEHTILEYNILAGSLYGNLGQIGEREDTDGDGTYGYIAVGEGEIHGALTAGFYVLDGNGNKVFSPGISAEVGGSFSVLHGEGQWQALGNENLGLNFDGEFSVGKVEAKAGAEVQVFGEDGKLNLQASAEAKAEAIVAEIEGSVGVNVLGGEVEVKGGVNFGVGAHAEIGIKDGVIKCDVGVSLGIGVSLAVEVDVGGMVNTVCEGAKSVWEGTKSVVKNIFKGW